MRTVAESGGLSFAWDPYPHPELASDRSSPYRGHVSRSSLLARRSRSDRGPRHKVCPHVISVRRRVSHPVVAAIAGREEEEGNAACGERPPEKSGVQRDRGRRR